jgi:pimeloyl-ACP methyl ester carboxylesterase
MRLPTGNLVLPLEAPKVTSQDTDRVCGSAQQNDLIYMEIDAGSTTVAHRMPTGLIVAESQRPSSTRDEQTDDGLPDTLLTTTSHVYAAALQLAARAYSDEHLGAEAQAASSGVATWTPLDPADLGSLAGSFSGSTVPGTLQRYEYENASASFGVTLLDGKKTLGIAFEGTNFSTERLDLWDDVVNLDRHAALLEDLMGELHAFAADPSNGIEKVLLSGHSLGGGVAQYYMGRYGADPRYEGVTFGSPGNLAVNPDAIDSNRFVNFTHTGDGVPFLGENGIKAVQTVGGAILAVEIFDILTTAIAIASAPVGGLAGVVAKEAIDVLFKALIEEYVEESAFDLLASFFGISEEDARAGWEAAYNRDDYTILGSRIRFDLERPNDTALLGLEEHDLFSPESQVSYQGSLQTYLV